MEINAGSLFKAVVALGGGAASDLYGGWSSLLGILLAFVAIDYLTGFVAAGTELLSFIENSGRIGLPVPPIITRAVELLSDKSKAHEVSKE